MFWRASFNEPPGRTDIRRSENGGRAEFMLGRDQRFENRTRMSFSDSFESVIGRNSLLLDAENEAGFHWSPQSRLRSTTSWTATSTQTGAANDQDVGNLRQKTFVGYQSFRGGRASAEHLYDRTRTVTGPIDVLTTQNRLRLETGRPWGPHEHRVTLRNMTTHITNSSEYRTLENRTDLQNEATLFTKRIRWRPRSTLLYTKTTRKNPNSAFNEFEIREVLEADRPRLWVLGNLLGVLEFGWRSRNEAEKIDTTVRVNWGLTLNRDFGPDYRLFLSASNNNETYETRLTTAGALPPPPRDPQRQRNYRVGFRAAPVSEIAFDTGYSYTHQADQTQTEFRFDVTVRIPKINVPITSGYINQTRTLTGRSDQSTTRWETKTGFNIRHIRIQIEHAYIAETLFIEDYGLNVFSAEIIRRFQVF